MLKVVKIAEKKVVKSLLRQLPLASVVPRFPRLGERSQRKKLRTRRQLVRVTSRVDKRKRALRG